MGHLGRRGSGGSGSGRNAHRCSMPRLTLYLVDPAPPPSPCLPRSPYRSAVARRRGVSLHDRTTPPSFHVFTIAPSEGAVRTAAGTRAKRGQNQFFAHHRLGTSLLLSSMLYTHAHRDSVAREGQGFMDTAAQRGSSQFDNTTRGVVIPVRAGRRMKGVAPRTNRGRIGTNQANADAFHTAERHTRVRVLPSCSVHTGPRPRAGVQLRQVVSCCFDAQSELVGSVRPALVPLSRT